MLLLPAVLFWTVMYMMSGKLENVKLAAVSDEIVPGLDDCENPHRIDSGYGCTTSMRLTCAFISYLRNKSYAVVFIIY